MKKDVDIYGIDKKDIKDFVTTEKDIWKQKIRIPSPSKKLDEKMIKEETKEIQKHEPIELIPIEQRKRKRTDGSNSTKEDPESEDSDGSEWYSQRRGSRSSTIYSRDSGESTCLEDFNILKTLGVGSFGKVFLVQHKEWKDLYAMKSIRKDKVIEYE